MVGVKTKSRLLRMKRGRHMAFRFAEVAVHIWMFVVTWRADAGVGCPTGADYASKG